VDSANNELRDWVAYARYANPKLRIAVKADMETPLDKVNRVIDILQDQNINKLNFVTNLRAKPEVKL
jgi:biopolymer transport protein ExbD